MEKNAPPNAYHSLSAKQILQMARSKCKPRKKLLDVAKSKVQMAKESARKAKQNRSPPARDIPLNVMKLVMIVLVAPFLSVSQYYDLLNLNYRQGNEAKNQALELKLLIQNSFHSGKRGGMTALLEPTSTASAMFRLPVMYKNPGFMHCFLERQVEKSMTEQGFKVTLEKCINGKKIDAVLERNNQMVAVEIAVSAKHEVVNLRKNIQAGFDRIVIVGKDRKVVSAVRKKLGAAFENDDVLSKVTCCVLAELVDGKVI